MAATATTLARPLAPGPGRVKLAVEDALAIAGRNLRAMTRVPEVIVFSTIQPVIFVLMFRYVFGGAIRIPGVDYVNYLMPGIFVQTVVFGGMNTVAGLSEDLSKGLIERFRSLPMARSAVLAGRTLADLVRNVGVVSLMVIVGYLVGFRVQTNVVSFLAAMGLLLFFAFALCWAFALLALSAGNAEAAQAASFPPLALLVFASSAFVPVTSMPGWLQAWAKVQPVSVTVDAVRALVLGGATTKPVLQSIAWSVGIIAVFGPLAVARYRRAA
jgi:ABC-2 type transport system permease protein/oleandomycin transport system permease protein